MKARIIVLAAALAAFTGAAATAAPEQSRGCTDVKLGLLAPLSGDAAFLGREQLSWARYAVSTYNKRSNTFFSLENADTQLSAAIARDAGRRLVADPRFLGVVGGSTNQSVLATGELFAKAGLASVSGSAGRPDLTAGKFSTFFRVVPNDGVEAPSIVRFVRERLKAKRVLVLAGSRDLSGLAASIASMLGDGVSSRRTIDLKMADLGEVAASVSGDTDLVVFAAIDAKAANTLAQELRERGKRAEVFGTDTHSPDLFEPRSGYTASFVNDIRFDSSARTVIKDYADFSRGRKFGTFGPASYTAAWVLMDAIERACEDGQATRAEVVARLGTTDVASILGGRVRFTAKGDLVGARFSIFRITDGLYRKVW